MAKRLSKEAYLEGILAGDRIILSRAITLCESSREDDRRLAEELLSEIALVKTSSIRLGITGSPGVGKSTFINSFGDFLLEIGHHLAVLAIDPSSGMTKGSILGDKTRMDRLVGKQGAYVRPSPSGGTLGGVASKTREAILLCEAAGYDWILVETVGVGQSETAVRQLVDLFLLLLLPNAGDDLQGIKKGVVEMADLLIINKADGDAISAAKRSASLYSQAIRLFSSEGSLTSQTVMTASAIEQKGFQEIYDHITSLESRLADSGTWSENRHRQEAKWFEELVTEGLQELLTRSPELMGIMDSLRRKVLEKQISPQLAAETLIRTLRKSLK